MYWLSPLEAVGSCVLQAGLFVGLLYLSSSGRLPRDDPRAIVARIKSVLCACVLSTVVVATWQWWRLPDWSLRELLAALGVWTEQLSVARLVAPVLSVALLFLGPLLHSLIDEPSLWTPAALAASARDCFTSLPALRNIVVAPTAEEWVFRACMCPLLEAAGFSFVQCVFLPPLLFGIAHMHHVFHHIRDLGRSVAQAIVVVLVQFTYTSAFGAIAAFYFMTTKSIVGPILAHSFCNSMGVPDFAGAVNHETHRVLLIATYIAGIVLFYVSVTLLLRI